MAKQLNIDMNIRANTDSAQAELKKLKQTLDDAINSTIKKSGNTKLTSEITEATQAAAKLKLALENATNVKTGNLDLSKFSEELSKSKMNLKQYSTQLLNLGSTGEKAFLQMASAIASAEIPLRRSNGLLTGLWTTMKNTARWQLSSTALHGFLGALQGAYGYAQNLNKSLNNIQIVTGQSSDQMAKFAEEANKSAKALSTTTTAYTDAALIYYQQGLSGDEVKERTDATIKLANVSRQSAEEVSSQMTSIWNNFSKGGENLEYYADVITKLGATTASSSSEIADGLSKFAAVADTVGLSYEKASAALATVVAETRQSADTVGTAFKTLFARVEGLQLGKTLEDGVDLNKYSKALDTVGVKILDNNKQIKQMDTILDELGAKWNTIGESEQIALAQTVAGVRQYTQFMSLMNNYDKVQKNQTVAEDSKGTLQKQADTYAESWEAANKRVKAAAQGIYDELLNDKFFIGLNNSVAGILEGINKFIKSLGGIPGVLGLLGTVATKVFKDQIALSIDNAVHNLAVFTGVAQDKAKQMQNDMIQVIEGMNNPGVTDKVQQAENDNMIKTLKLTQQLSEKKDKLLEQDYEQLKLLTDITAQYGEYSVLATKKAEEADKKQNSSRQNAVDMYVDKAVQSENPSGVAATTKVMEETRDGANDVLDEIQSIITRSEAGRAAVNAINEALKGDGSFTPEVYEQVSMNLLRIEETSKGLSPSLDKVKTAMENHKKVSENAAKAEKELSKAQDELNKIEKDSKASAQDLEKARKKVDNAMKASEKQNQKLKESEKEVKEASINAAKGLQSKEKATDSAMAHSRQAGAVTKQESLAIKEYIKSILDSIKADNEAIVAQQNHKKSAEDTEKAIAEASSTMTTSFGQGLTTTFQGISQLSMGINSLKGMFETLNNTDMSFGEKFLSVATSLGMAIPSLVGGLSNLKQGFGVVKEGVESGVKAFVLHIGAMTADEAASESLTFAEVRRAFNTAVAKKVTDAETTSLWADVVAKVAAKIATDSLNAAMLLLLAAILLVVAAAVALVAIFNAIKANSPEEKLKKAEENAKALAEAFEDAKNRAQELKDSFNKYNEIVNKLDSCVKGTEEWRDTLKEVNSQVLSLIEQYPELSKYVTTDSDGVMRISKEGQTKLTDKANQAVSVAEAASVEANREVRQKKMDVQVSNISAKATQTIPGQSYSGTNSGTSSKNTTDASNMVKRYLNENREKLAEMTKDQLKANLEAYFDKNNISGNMDDWVTAAQELTKAVKEDTETTKAETKAIVSNRLADNKKVSASTESKEINDASSQLYDDLIEKQTKKLKDDGWGTKYISKADGANEKAKAVWDEYLKAANLDPSKYKLTDTTGDDNNRKFVYNDENGEKKEITLEQMRATKASSEALKELDSTAEQITKDFQKLSVSTDKTDQALESFLANKNFESASAGEVADFSKFVSNGKANTESIKKYLTEQAGELGYKDLTSMAKEYGYKSDEYVKAFSEKAVDISKAWDDIDLEKMGLDKTKGWAQNLSSTAAKALSDNFDKIKFGPKGEKAAQEYVDGIGRMIEGLDVDDQKKALEDLAKIDWSGYNAFDEAVTTMKKYGKTLDENDPKWDAFIADMRKANSSVPDFSSLNENLTSMSKILEKLNFGDIIEDGDYEKLIKYKDAWKEFFMMQADGTRKFIGDADEMKRATQESIREAKKDMEERKDIQDELNKDNTVNSEDWEKKANDIIDSKDSGGNKQKDKVSLSTGVLNNTNVKAALNAQGYTEEDITRIVNNYNDSLGSTSKSAKDAKESMANLYKAIGDFSTEAINTKDQQEKLNEELASTATNLNDLKTMYENSEISADAYDKQLISLAMAAESLSELQDLKDNGGILDEESEAHYLDTEEYGRALMSLAENYDNCTNEVSEYQQALASGSAELINETQAILENSIAVGEMAKSLDLEADSVEEQAKELISVNKLSEENYKVATKVAVLNQSMNKGVQDLVDNWSKYKDTLKKSEKGTEDYANAALNTKKALAQLLGVTDEEFIPDDFLEMPGVMDLIDKAVEGDEKAINSLGVTMAKATIEAMEFKDGLEGINGVKLTSEAFNNYKNEVLEGITSLTDAIKNGTVQAGENITSLMNGTGQSWAEALNEMAYTTGMSVEEMNSLLNELGVQADVTTKTKTVKTKVPQYETIEEVVSDTTGGGFLGLGDKRGTRVTRSSTRVVDYKEMDGAIEVAQINMGKANAGTPPTITYAGRDNVSSSALTPSSSSSSGDSSSSSSSTPTTKAASHNHEVNRYSAEENAIDGLSKQYEHLNDAKDKAFGKSKIQAIENEIKKLKELKQASSNYLDAIVGSRNGKKVAEALYKGESLGKLIQNGNIGGTLAFDYNALFSGPNASGKQVEYTAKDESGNEWLETTSYNLNDFNNMFGSNLSFALDSFGHIQNKDSILNAIQEMMNSENDAYSSIANPSASSTTEYNKRIAYLELIKENIEQFEGSVEDAMEQADGYLDYITQLQEKNAELITEKMDQDINLSEKSIQKLNRALKVLGNDIYRSGESLVKAYKINEEKIDSEEEKAEKLMQEKADADRRYQLYQEDPFNEDAITPEAYGEFLDRFESEMDTVIDNLQEYQNFYYDTYTSMLDYWDEKMSNIMSSMEHSLNTLDYYLNVLDLMGKADDYDMIGTILKKQQKIAEDMLYSSQERVKTYESEYEAQKKILENIQKDPVLSQNKDLIDEQLKIVQAAKERLEDAESEFQENHKNTLDFIYKEFENDIEKAFSEYEKFLSGEYGSFDNFNASMDRQKSLKDDYLTKTNQIYETNKMLRKINQDIDKTDSLIGKNELKTFSKIIEAMQEREKLSKTDLEIAQAKYDILQAQIALEDAQNAKSTVQLRRDSEGNYGYVYTADQEAIDNAQQNLEDKLNALYNLTKTAVEDFKDQMIQLEQETAEAEKEIMLNSLLSTEEKNERLAELHEYTLERQQQLSEQYGSAIVAFEDSAYATRLAAQGDYNTASLVALDQFDTNTLKLEETTADLRAEAWNDSFTSSMRDQDTYKAHYNALMSSLKIAMNNLDNERARIAMNTNTSNEEIKRSTDRITNAMDDLSYEMTGQNGLVSNMNAVLSASNTLSSSFSTQYDRVNELIGRYSAAADEANKLYNRTVNLINAQTAYNGVVQNGWTEVNWKTRNDYDPAGSSGSGSGSGGSGSFGGGSGSSGNGSNNQNNCNNGHNWIHTGSFLTRNGAVYEKIRCKRCSKEYEEYVGRADKITSHIGYMDGRYHGEYKGQVLYWKSGGYTGTWPASGKTGLYTGSWNGPDIEENGKLAFLHQKELVLNADDTENVLSAVKLIRQISESIDLQAAAQSSYSVGTIQFPNNNQVLQQEVTIHAEFPNATDHNEIEEAFNSLVNRATQYANRN